MGALQQGVELLTRERRLRRRIGLSAALIFLSLWLVGGFALGLLSLLLFCLLYVAAVALQARRERPGEAEIHLARRLVLLRVERYAYLLLFLLTIERTLNLLPDLSRPFLALLAVAVALLLGGRELWVVTARQMPMPWERLPLGS